MAINFWWRDDDAGRDHPNLEKLVELAATVQVPICLAVVPSWLDRQAIAAIGSFRDSTVIQHGWAHRNNAYPGHKKIELGGTASIAAHQRLLLMGRDRLEAAFGDRFRQILAPPWNRIDAHHRRLAADLGYRAISTFSKITFNTINRPICRIDTNIDAIDWHNNKRTKSASELASEAKALRLRGFRTIGLLTHHLEHDETAFGEIKRFIHKTSELVEAQWVTLGDLSEARNDSQSSGSARSQGFI